MTPDRMASPSLSQTPNCTNDLKDLSLTVHPSTTSSNSQSTSDNSPNTASPASSATTSSTNPLSAPPASYSPSVFNGSFSANAFDSKSSLSLSPNHAHHAGSYGGYAGTGHGPMDFATAGYAGTFYPGSAMLSSKTPFSVSTGSSSPGDKSKSKRTNTGQLYSKKC